MAKRSGRKKGTRHYKGHEGIKQAHNRTPSTPPDGTAPVAAPAPRTSASRSTWRSRTSQVIVTKYRQQKAGDPMKFTTQDKEYATWVEVKGQWLYKTRQIASGNNPPDDWKE